MLSEHKRKHLKKEETIRQAKKILEEHGFTVARSPCNMASDIENEGNEDSPLLNQNSDEQLHNNSEVEVDAQNDNNNN